MARVLLVSNRLPVNVIRRGGELRLQESVGGVAVGLASLHRDYGGLWVGWPGIALERSKGEAEEIEDRMRELDLLPVFLTQQEVEQFYYGFCNRTIWPLFHYFTHYAVHSKKLWEAYQSANEKVADAVAESAAPGDTVWVHDYQLMLVPELLRSKGLDISVGFFLHIPFPSFEIFRLLPWREEILQGMLGADLIGFHTYDYVRHFISCVRRLLGHENTLGNISYGSRVVRADAFPMGIDYGRFENQVSTPEAEKEIRRVRKKVGNRKVVLSVDRLDYTKGIPERLEAFSRFLAANPEYEDKVSMIMVAVPSRTRVEHYVQLKRRVDELVGRINGRYGSLDWMPVWYLYRSLPFQTLSALYSMADVALVTPLRDGMNLIAKEFIASKIDGKGVLVLSELAGASNVMGEAVIVNPNNRNQVVEAIGRALNMPENEQIERNRAMQARLRRYDMRRWGGHFLDTLSTSLAHQAELLANKLTDDGAKELQEGYSRSNKRLVLLDYDGTLVSFAEKPSFAEPDEAVTGLLASLAEDKRNTVVIVSGRDRDTLERWFGGLDVGMIAEHGVWIREGGKDWFMIQSLRNKWKQEVLPFLEPYLDKAPGSFIEEKDFSLVWHYRNVEPGLGGMRAGELRDELFHLTANLDLEVLEGSKVVEIKNSAAKKSRAAMHWLAREAWDFILAVGDDLTDEDLFTALPESAYSIRVGLTPSKAKFNLESHKDVRALLRGLTYDPGADSILVGRNGTPRS